MLVLTIKIGERVHVGDCVITVLEKSGRVVRLGFVAPKDVNIVREKPREEKQETK